MRYLHRLAGALVSGGPLLLLVASRLGAVSSWPAQWTLSRELAPLAAVIAASALVCVAGVALPIARRLARLLLVLAGGLFAALLARHVIYAPGPALAVLSGMAVVLYLTAPPGIEQASAALERASTSVVRVRAACASALAGGLSLSLLGAPRPIELGALAASLALAWWVSLSGLVRGQLGLSSGKLYALGFAAIGSLLSTVAIWGKWAHMVGALALVPVAVLVLVPRPGGPSAILRALVDAVLSHPARLLVVTFVGLCGGGAVLLKLPLAAAPGRTISGIDAFFTSTSAVCVTGLIVLDTPNDLSRAGQAFIALLIQLGGLGIMSFSTAAIALLGRRFSLRHEAAIADLVAQHRGEMFDAVKRMLVVTFGLELCGALCLWPLFASAGDGVGEALWRAVFTAVSAFCNAGFALQSDSLIAYARTPAIIHVVGALIVLGGLSPAVVAELPRIVRRKPLSLHARVVLIVSAVLLLGGTAVIAAIEWSHALVSLSRIERLHNAWFQALTPRTAGFNSVDVAALRPATIWLMTGLMFLGGSPGSTAGGIKTTTVAVLFIAVRSAMRGRWEATAFGRRLSTATVYKAAALTTMAATTVVVAVTALQVTQPIPLDQGLFEVVSALGTVGLSMGATPTLDDVGKVIIMACMFLGRVGPLTLFLFLRDRHSDRPWRLPETELDVG